MTDLGHLILAHFAIGALYALTFLLLAATLILFGLQLFRARMFPASLEASPETHVPETRLPLFHAPYPYEPPPPPRPSAPGAQSAPRIIALNLPERLAMDENGKTWPITDMFDFEGDNTDDPDEALSVVVATNPTWIALPVADYCWPRPVH